MHLAYMAEAMSSYETGATYVDYLELDGASPERVRAAYLPEDWERLVELKTATTRTTSSASTATYPPLRWSGRG